MFYWKSLSVRASVLFTVVGFAWILLSDRILTWFAVENELSMDMVTIIQNTKGIFFVLVCAAGLFLVIHHSTKKLERTQEEYRNLFRFNPGPMFIYNPQTGRLLTMNEAGCKQYGYSYKEVKTLHIRQIRISDFDDSEFNSSLNTYGMKDAGRYRHRKKDGTEFWVHKYTRKIEFGAGTAQVVLAFDVTAQVLAETRLLKQNQHLADLAWFESHKLRAPIARLLGLLNIINVQQPHHPQNEVVLQHLRDSGTELDQLVRQLSIKTMVGRDEHSDVA